MLKGKNMNTFIAKTLGFDKEVSAVEQGKCPFCENTIVLSEFKDARSMKEFEISGLCAACQDDTFGSESLKDTLKGN